MTIFFQGEQGAYSDLAAKIIFPEITDRKGLPQFSDVFAEISKNPKTSIAVLPIENSIHGSVHPVFDLLQKHHFFIHTEYKLKIEHCLLSNFGATLTQITEVYSHPQALGQCATFFAKHPEIKPIPWYDTAGSAKHIFEQKGNLKIAAIASKEASRVYNLEILESNIESFDHNFTRFLVIGANEKVAADADKTSIIIETKNSPGALYNCLGVFAENEIDLLKIESRPVWGKPWKHLFYLDLRGNFQNQKEKNALFQLNNFTEFIRILGSYKEDKTEDGHETIV